MLLTYIILLNHTSLSANTSTPPPPSGYPAGWLFMKYWENLTRSPCAPWKAITGFMSGSTESYGTPLCTTIGSSWSGNTAMNGTLNYIPKFTPNGNSIGNSTIYENAWRIGIGTINPERQVHIQFNNAGEWGGKNRALEIENTATANGSNSTVQIKTNTVNARSAIDFSTASQTYGGVFWYHHGLGRFEFWTSTDGSEWSPKVFINKLWNIGIWAGQPTTHLHIVSDKNSFWSILLEGNEANGDGVSRANIAFKDVSPWAFWAQWNVHIVGSAQWVTSNYAPGSFAINRAWWYKGQSNRDGFVINPETMSVGIGITKPTEKLEVSWNVKANGYLTQSDRRMKDNTRRIDSALKKLLQVHGYTFEWKDSWKDDIGVLAQEVEQVFPELVHTAWTWGYKSVEYGNLIAPAIEAIRELDEKNVSQEKRIDALLQKIEDQEKRIEKLEIQCK